jgi:hypothetical protein
MSRMRFRARVTFRGLLPDQVVDRRGMGVLAMIMLQTVQAGAQSVSPVTDAWAALVDDAPNIGCSGIFSIPFKSLEPL